MPEKVKREKWKEFFIERDNSLKNCAFQCVDATHAPRTRQCLCFQKEYFNKTRILPLGLHNVLRGHTYNLGLRSESDEQNTPSTLILAEKGQKEKRKGELALYIKQEFSPIQRTPLRSACGRHKVTHWALICPELFFHAKESDCKKELFPEKRISRKRDF